MKTFINFFRSDLLFSISFILAIIACGAGRFALSFVDGDVILTLLGLMAVIKVLERLGVLDFFAAKLIQLSKDERALVTNLTFLAFFSSMILTNDIAILTLLPVFLKIIGRNKAFKSKILGTTLIIIAANLGSSSLPFGNPQNLYLYGYYDVPFGQFEIWMLPFFLLSAVSLLVITRFINKNPLEVSSPQLKKISTRQLALALVGLLLMILAILHILPLAIAVVVSILLVVLADLKALKEVDYRLLATFIFFFLIVGNLAEIPTFVAFIQNIMGNFLSVLVGSSLISQLISNVPAALLLAPFTEQSQALLLGVNIGGLGTLVASLANLIGFKVFSLYAPGEKGKLLRNFSLLNFCLLAVFLLFFSLFNFF
ncbi:SLC13 family permease [Enterococcus sp. HY326]|uniref:SLC13 family permease n=1 Tax=Enterococcus sp. HY326 TaxID=2971265 RepID=UPI0022403754|nr:SLC13 family permease [Enterococcus sp. HY326]